MFLREEKALKNKCKYSKLILTYKNSGGKKMALIKCSECGRKISDKATICPICGCPVENNKSCDSVENEESEIIVATAQPQRKRNKKVVVFVLLIMLFIIGSILTFKGLYKSRFENCAYSTAVALKEILKNYKKQAIKLAIRLVYR